MNSSYLQLTLLAETIFVSMLANWMPYFFILSVIYISISNASRPLLYFFLLHFSAILCIILIVRCRVQQRKAYDGWLSTEYFAGGSSRKTE